MNRALHELAPLEVDPDSLRDAVRAMLHTIIFHRFSGIVRPTDVACDVLDVTFATCGDSAVAAKVDEAAGLFPTTLRPSASGLAGRLVLCFQYKRKVHGIFFSREQRDTWEEWVVPFIVRTSLEGVDRGAFSASVERSLTRRIMDIIKAVGAADAPLSLPNSGFQIKWDDGTEGSKVQGSVAALMQDAGAAEAR